MAFDLELVTVTLATARIARGFPAVVLVAVRTRHRAVQQTPYGIGIGNEAANDDSGVVETFADRFGKRLQSYAARRSAAE